MSFHISIIILDIILISIIKNGSGFEYQSCNNLLVGYYSQHHGDIEFHFDQGSPTILFSSTEALHAFRYDKNFVTIVKSANCIKIFAWVKTSYEVAGLMEIMNKLRKVALKNLIVNVKKPLNMTILKNIMINYEVNILENNTGFTFLLLSICIAYLHLY